jgi:hypothetical protein
MDLFDALCWSAPFVLPAWVGFRWWRSRTRSMEALEAHANREEARARKKFERSQAFERTSTMPPILFKGAAPSLPADHPDDPQWETSAEYAERRRRALISVDDPAPIFDEMFRRITQEPDGMVTSFADVAADNDNAVKREEPESA